MLSSPHQLQKPFALPDRIRQRAWVVAFVTPVLAMPIWFVLAASTLAGLILFLLLVSSSVTDLSGRKIYNWATYSAFAWAITLNTFAASTQLTGAIGLRSCLAGAGICFALMVVPYTLARGGAGDVKLAVAIGALVGVDEGVLIIAFTYIIAGVAIGSWTIWAHGPLGLITSMLCRCGSWLFPSRIAPPMEHQAELLQKPIPLAGFFAVATLLVRFDLVSVLRSL